MKPNRALLTAAILVQAVLVSPRAGAENGEPTPFITEAYYRIKWGHFDEFMELFKKNHYPILEELQKQGVIESMEAAFPVNHASEESRWDFRMRITLFDTDRMAREFPRVSKQLYPDQEQLRADERHRFGLLDAHTDVVIRLEDLSSW